MTILSFFLLLQIIPVAYSMGLRSPIIEKYGPSNLFIEKGGTGILNCTLSSLTPDATVQWTKDGQNIYPATDSRFATNEQNDLLILNAQAGSQYSEGKYRCSATNSVNTTSNDWDLNVQVTFLERDFIYPPRDSFFYDIDGKRLAWTNCEPPKSVPLAAVTFINGSSLRPVNTSDPRVEVRKTPRSGSLFYQLLIYNATKYDEGRWQCRAINTLGRRIEYFQVTLYGPPKGAQGMRVKEHRLNGFIMVWDFLRIDLLFYDIKLTKVSTNEVQNFKLDEDLNFSEQTLSYQFYNLERGTEYNVEMRATSTQHQTGEWSQKLQVKTVSQIAPVITKQPGKASVGEGQTFNMSCGVDASPAATFKWYKNGVVIPSTDQKYAFAGHILVIKNAIHGEKNSEGKYKCEATNILGKATSEEAQLTVEWMESKFQYVPGTKIFYNGQTFLRISARAPVGSALQVTWKKAGMPILTRTHPQFSVTHYLDPLLNFYHALDIRTLNTRIEDKYTVTASNLGGIRTAEFELILAGNPPAIDSLTMRAQAHGQIVLQWTPPKASDKLVSIGEEYRQDFKSFDISYKDTTNNEEKTISTVGTFVDTKYFMRKHAINGIKVGVLYEYRIRMIDRGNQVGAWSFVFEHSIPSSLPPFISKGPDPNYVVKENKTQSISCVVSSTPAATVTWYKDDVAIANTNANYIISNDKIELVNVQPNHAGEYYCKAMNDLGETKSDVGTVTVHYLDNVFLRYDAVTPVYNIDGKQDVRILCLPPKSNPPAKVLWSNSSDYFLPEDSTFIRDNNYVVDGVKYFSLEIKRAIDYVGSEIGCAAYNDGFGFNVNYKLALTRLTLFGKPVWTKPITYIWKVGPVLSVTWEKERTDIVTYAVSVKNNISPFEIVHFTQTPNTSAEISGLQDRSYRLEVIAIDGGGQKSEPATTTVQAFGESLVQVKVDLLPTVGPFPEGSNAELNCDFSGKPKPHITWLKDGVNITIKNSSYEVANDNRQMKLINISRSVHPGKYRCIASNTYFKDVPSTLSTVGVQWFDDKFKYVDTEKSFYDKDGYRSVKFTCSPPESFPAISETNRNVHWLKGPNQLPITGRKTTVTENTLIKDSIEFEAMLADLGTISCAYVHPAGTRVHNMTLKLVDGPLPPRNMALKTDRFNRVTLTWTASEDVADSYRIEHNDGTIDVAADKTTFTIYDLKEEQIYKISLFAVKNGKSSLPLTDEILTVKKPDIPSVVTGVIVSNVKKTNVTISWSLPTKRAGNNKIEYSVNVCKGVCKSYGWMIETTVVVKDLQPTTLHSFEIVARGDEQVNGTIYQGSFTTASKDGPPVIPEFKISYRKWNAIQLIWVRLDDLSKIDKIILETNITNKRRTELDSTVTDYTFADLKKATTYSFVIYAIDKNGGRGLSAQLVASTLKLGKPGAATAITVKNVRGKENSQVEITWRFPKDTELGNNLPSELQYQLEYCTGGTCKTKSSSQTKLTLVNLKPASKYTYTLTTVGVDGTVGGSITGDFTMHTNKPSKPRSVSSATSGATTLLLSWVYPDILAGTPKIEMKFMIVLCETAAPSKCENKTANGNSYTLTGLRAATAYSISITPINKDGEHGEMVTFEATTKNVDVDDNDGVSAGVIVGIVIAILVVLLILVVTFKVWQRRKREIAQSSRVKKMPDDHEYQMQQQQQYRQRQQLYQQQQMNLHQQQQQQQQYRRPPPQQQRYAPNRQHRRNEYAVDYEMDRR